PTPTAGAQPGLAPTAADPAIGDATRFAAIQAIVAARCAPCHGAVPSQAGFATAPKGLVLDTPEALLTHTAMIAPQVAAGTMPIGNLTGMTDTERTQLLDWIRHGARH
ncbi:MAG: hypothetical protein M3N97_01555, partial [Pseudomonadota bacterium]|nr:hypothetical protein [Pseudomonadota bacterium]